MFHSHRARISHAQEDPGTAPGPCIWGVASGKGGVGKSLITSSLAITLAGKGQCCVLVDADLGAANLHTLLGVRARWNLSSFLDRECEELTDALSPTCFPNLSLISGDQSRFDVANLKHAQKERLLRQIQRLQAGHVFLDIGAGSAYNALDFFLAADHPVLVVVPEPTSVENTYHFLKAAYFRSLRGVARQQPLKGLIQQVLAESKRRLRSPIELIDRVRELNPEAADRLHAEAMKFLPKLIVNQVRGTADYDLGPRIEEACKRYLGTGVDYLGALRWDALVPEAVLAREPVLRRYPGSDFALDLELVSHRIFEARERALAVAEEPTQASDSGFESRPAPELSEPGRYLEYIRRKQGQSLDELRHRTRILALEQIEQERFDELPPLPYTRSFVLQYARELGIPEADILAARFIERYRQARDR